MAESVSFSYLQTANNRFSGLASGMDIDSIVEKLMKAESMKMEKLQQQKQKYEWQRDAYRDINSKLEAFRKDAFDNYKPSDFLAKAATVSDPSKVSVEATASANGTLTISSATLATTGYKKVSLTANGSTASSTTTLGELGVVDNGGSYTMKLNVLQKDGKMKETNITYSASEKIGDFVNKLNTSGAGITAIFNNGEMSISSNATGNVSGGSVQVTSDNGAVFQELGFTANATGEITNGTDASYTINGITKTSDSNSFTELGYNITLNNTISSNVTISSGTDTDAIVDKVKSFIELYNGLVESLNSKVDEKKSYSYQPLTDAQKAEMTDDEIKKWEEQAKQGILRNDSVISSVISSMREMVYAVQTTKDSKFNALYNIGITTSKEEASTGKLSIDENKLRKAIEANPEAISDLFTRAAVVDPTTKKVTEQGGIITRLRTSAKSAIDLIGEKAGKSGAVDNTFTLGRTLISVDERIEEWKDRLKRIEDRYYRQFTAMEEAMNKANSQSSIFMQG